MSSKSFIIAISGLTLAFATGYRLGGSSQPNAGFANAADLPEMSECSGLKDKFSQISEIDIAEYQTLRDQKDRYEKADEILGKIMLIFLTELGIKSPTVVAHSKKPESQTDSASSWR